jgi:hypothetical protein
MNLVDRRAFRLLSYETCLEPEVMPPDVFDHQGLVVKQQVMQEDTCLATSLAGLERTDVTLSLSSRTRPIVQRCVILRIAWRQWYGVDKLSIIGPFLSTKGPTLCRLE